MLTAQNGIWNRVSALFQTAHYGEVGMDNMEGSEISERLEKWPKTAGRPTCRNIDEHYYTAQKVSSEQKCSENHRSRRRVTILTYLGIGEQRTRTLA